MVRWLSRGALVVGGAFISAVCYALTIKADLGLGPLYAVQEGISEHLEITVGQSVMVVGATLCVIAALLREWPGLGTVSLPFIMGSMVDAILPHTPDLDGLVLGLVVVAVASWFMALGGALVIRSKIGAAAPDLVMLALSRRSRFNNRQVRLAMEASWLAMGWLLGGTIGVGTVMTGLLIGPALHFWIEQIHSEAPEQEHVVV